MDKKTHLTTRKLSITIVIMVILLTISGQVLAKQNIVAIEDASFVINASMSQNLKSFIGKKINVTLDSGQVISGTVKSVGDHMLHLEKLSGKEYYDALIRIENIGAFDSRFRKIQR